MTAVCGGVRLRAPFPWFGGKSAVADIVWDRFGNPPNYVEPFAGSLAVLLGRPTQPKVETVNDADCYLANFWRALRLYPDDVAMWADSPVNEADLRARHLWLIQQADFRERMMTDPDYCDPKIAGWWAWGVSCWIGSGWCSAAGTGTGVKRPKRQRPELGNAGTGVNRTSMRLRDELHALAARLRRVRVVCGDWARVCGGSVTWQHGVTAVLLDPPYADTANRDPHLYAVDSLRVAHDVREWAIEAGKNPLMRVALCGYDGEHEMPDDWDVVSWKTSGGYAKTGNSTGSENASRERIWFSPHCLRPQMNLFA